MSTPCVLCRNRVFGVVAACLMSVSPQLLAQDPFGQFWQPYLDSAWSTIKHDPFGSNFSQFRFTRTTTRER